MGEKKIVAKNPGNPQRAKKKAQLYPKGGKTARRFWQKPYHVIEEKENREKNTSEKGGGEGRGGDLKKGGNWKWEAQRTVTPPNRWGNPKKKSKQRVGVTFRGQEGTRKVTNPA